MIVRLACVIALCCVARFVGLSQTNAFGLSQGCHVNVNHGSWSSSRFDVKNATFRARVVQPGKNPGVFSAVMIDRDVPDASMDFYFITARHCVKDMDVSATHTLSFNYQSPDNTSGNTPLSNRGTIIMQASRTDPNFPDLGF